MQCFSARGGNYQRNGIRMIKLSDRGCGMWSAEAACWTLYSLCLRRTPSSARMNLIRSRGWIPQHTSHPYERWEVHTCVATHEISWWTIIANPSATCHNQQLITSNQQPSTRLTSGRNIETDWIHHRPWAENASLHWYWWGWRGSWRVGRAGILSPQKISKADYGARCWRHIGNIPYEMICRESTDFKFGHCAGRDHNKGPDEGSLRWSALRYHGEVIEIGRITW